MFVDLYEHIKEKIKDEKPDITKKETAIELLRFLKKYLSNLPSVEFLDSLASQPYEKKPIQNKTIVFIPFLLSEEEICNRIDVAVSGINDCNIPTMKKEKEIDFVKVGKSIRKLINPVSDQVCYVFHLYDEYNYVPLGSTQLSKLEGLIYYRCKINGPMNWKCSLIGCKKMKKGYRETHLFACVNNEYTCYENRGKTIDKELDEKLSDFKITSEFRERIKQNIKQVAKECSKRKIGTSFIIFNDTSDAEAEAERLANADVARGYKLHWSQPVKDIFDQVLDIDGGLIIDAKGDCFAYGCIFDGVTTPGFHGERARGARHNSMKLYIENINEGMIQNISSESKYGPCRGVVFSEDGGYMIY